MFGFKDSYLVRRLKLYTNVLESNSPEKIYFNFRFIRLMEKLEKNARRSSIWYYFLNSVVTVGSIIVPSLLAVQDRSWQVDATDEEQKRHENNVYWSVWSISLGVTLSNAFIKLLALDKTYITRNLRLNQYRMEVMKYITKSGKYTIEDDIERFNCFVNNIERIKEYQMLEEYTPQQKSEHTLESISNV
jgi:hypothetical protein